MQAPSADQSSPRRGARQRRTRTREALLLAARGLMAQDSRAAFTVDELIGVAGVAKGSFYNHFADKDAIVDQVHRELRELEEAEVRAVNHEVADPLARIARGMAVYARMALSSPEDARILTLSRTDSVFLDSVGNAGLVADIRAALRDGGIVVPSIEAAVLLVVGQAVMLMTRLRDPQAQAAHLFAQQCIAITLVGLGLDHRAAQLLATQAVDAILPSDPARD